MYKDYSDLADKLQKVGELRYEQGEITLLEKNMTITIASEMRNKLFQAAEEEKIAVTRFNWVCYSKSDIVPADSALSLLSVNYVATTGRSTYFNYFDSKVMESRKQLNVEKSRFFPEISFGYVRQDIYPLKGLSSWMVGISFPVFFMPQQSKIKQAKEASFIAQTEAENNKLELNNKIYEAETNLKRQNQSLQYYTASALKESEELIKVTTLQLQHSETNITDFIQAINTARDIRRGYIETVYQFNIAALEYELYK